MTDLRFRRLEQHRVGGTRDEMKLSYPVPRSPSGKIYQYSPNTKAVPRLFLVGDAPQERVIAPENHDRIRRDPGPGATVCPYSGFTAEDEEFIHFEDVDAIIKQVKWEAAADVEDHLAQMAKDFNRRQPRNSFVSIKMDFKPARRPRPLAIREDLLRDLRCNVCGRNYAVYAIALFCPDCGSPNYALHFHREVGIVNEEVALADSQGAAGKAELAYRLMGNAHEDVLTAFETALKTLYRHVVERDLPDQYERLCSAKEIGNAFQNVDKAHDRFAAINLSPFAVLAPDEVAILRVNIQKRHVIGHNLGLADERYSELTQGEQPGETVALIGAEISRFADICLRVVSELERTLLPKPTKNDGGAGQC